jgi:hypothetical protein
MMNSDVESVNVHTTNPLHRLIGPNSVMEGSEQLSSSVGDNTSIGGVGGVNPEMVVDDIQQSILKAQKQQRNKLKKQKKK